MPRSYSETEMPPPSSWVAGEPWMEAVGGALEGAATGFAAGQMIKRQKVESSQKAQLARQLRDGLITEGVPQGLADAAALQIVREGKDIVAALNDIRKTAAEVLAKEGGAAKDRATAANTQESTKWIGPTSEAGIAGTRATTDKTIAEATAIPEETKFKGITAGAAATTAETGRISTNAKIEQETRDYEYQYDTDRSGTIELPERAKWLTVERAALRNEIRKARKAKTDDLEPDNEILRLRDMTPEEMDAEVIKRVDDKISDYEFGRANLGKLGQPKPRLTTDLNTDWMKSPAPKPDTVTADQSGNTSDSQTQAAIVELKKLPMNPGVTPDQVRNAIRFRYPNVDVEEVAKALGF